MQNTPQPVFVDASGRRRRLMRRVGIAAGAVTTGFVLLLGYGLATGSGVPLTPWSGPDSGHTGSRAARGPHDMMPSLGDKGGAGGSSGGPSARPNGPAPSPGARPPSTQPSTRPGGTSPGTSAAPSATPTSAGTTTPPGTTHQGNPHGDPPGLAKKSPRP